MNLPKLDDKYGKGEDYPLMFSGHNPEDIRIACSKRKESFDLRQMNRPQMQERGRDRERLPGSIILRQHTLKYLPQVVPNSTLSNNKQELLIRKQVNWNDELTFLSMKKNSRM